MWKKLTIATKSDVKHIKLLDTQFNVSSDYYFI